MLTTLTKMGPLKLNGLDCDHLHGHWYTRPISGQKNIRGTLFEMHLKMQPPYRQYLRPWSSSTAWPDTAVTVKNLVIQHLKIHKWGKISSTWFFCPIFTRWVNANCAITIFIIHVVIQRRKQTANFIWQLCYSQNIL